jgi:branched-subunit amino acid permease
VSETREAPAPHDARLEQARPVLLMFRSFLIRALAAALLYSFLAVGSKGECFTEPEETCIQIEIGPSPFVYLAIALIAIGAFRAVDRRAVDAHDAARMLTRRLWLIVAIVVVSFVAIGLWIAFYPIEGWPRPGTWFFPFPFGAAELTRS